jgi:replication factor A1
MTEVPRTEIYDGQSRGRPRGNYRLFRNPLKSIVLIAKKHDVDPNLLIDAFVEAWRHKVSHCGSLTISCRTVNQDSATFLLTNEETVISQFPIKQEALKIPDSFRHYIQYVPTPAPSLEKGKPRQKKINELKSGMKGIGVTAKIMTIPPRKLVDTRWGGQSYVSNISITDETGTIQLSLWNKQIDSIHVGDMVEIENGYVASFAGEPQLRLGRKGTLSTVNTETAI